MCVCVCETGEVEDDDECVTCEEGCKTCLKSTFLKDTSTHNTHRNSHSEVDTIDNFVLYCS